MTVGVLTDKGMALDTGKMIARINDKPYDVPAFLLPDLAGIEKKTEVVYEQSNNVLSKIAANKKPVPVEKPTPVKPEIKIFDGAILSINHEKRALALDGGAILVWSPDLDDQMKAFHARYKCKVEHDGEHVLSIVSTFVPSNGNGKLAYQRNEKLIAFLALHRDAVQMFQSTTVPDTADFDKAMDAVYSRAERDLAKAIGQFGGA